MNLIKLSWCYLKAKPLSTILSLILVTLGVSLVSVMLLLEYQFKDRLYRNLDNIDLVVGAKGSPLQMILSSVYHVDVPTGNIPMSEAPLVTKNPFIEKAIPLALGDSYEGHRIVGTDHQYPEHYKAKVAQGALFDADLEVTVGALVAERLNLKIGDTFYGAHGLEAENMHVHDEYAYEVVGIFERNNTVLDQLLLTHYSSVWRVHESHDDEEEEEHEHGDADDGQPREEATDSLTQTTTDSSTSPPTQQHKHGHSHNGHEHGDHGHEQHSHDHDHGSEGGTGLAHLDSKGKEMTAYLVQYKQIPKIGPDGQPMEEMETSSMAMTMVPMLINDNSEILGYAVPAVQLQRLLEMTGVGTKALNYLAWIIIIISAFSVFISLYSSLKDRRYEIALMRTMGASRAKIFMMVVLEGLMIVGMGLFLGSLISHVGVAILAGELQESYQYEFSGWIFLQGELWIGLVAFVIGFVASLIPAFEAYSTDISNTLAK